MSDAHGNVQNHEFRLALIRDPRFADVVNDIVLELGNALYQDVADRFVSGGDVTYSELRQIWENTVVTTGGNNYLMIEELLRAVRDVNTTRPADRRIRVLLGDPPIDWTRVRTREDWTKFLELRDSYPAALSATRSHRQTAPCADPLRPPPFSAQEHPQQLRDGLLAGTDVGECDRSRHSQRRYLRSGSWTSRTFPWT